MKKLFLVFVFLAGVLSAKDVPLRVKFQTSDKYPSIEITSLYDGIITIDHAKIVANKGRNFSWTYSVLLVRYKTNTALSSVQIRK